MVKVLVPSGALGLGYDRAALARGIAAGPDIIAIDGGSTDSGPHYLGTGTSKYSRSSTKAEWRELMAAQAEAGVPLVEHDDVAGISFTGSPGTARDIAARAATSLKRTSFELGGKSANIIFADANLKKAIPAAAASSGLRGAKGDPSSRISPASARRLPPSTFINVDLPAPFSPTSPRTRPAPTAKETSLSARVAKKLLST